MLRLISSLFLVLVLLGTALPTAWAQDNATPTGPLSSGLTVLANGLDSPRGFTWGPDGTLYLAIAGRGGDDLLPAAPGFTVHNGLTSSVVTVAAGCTTPVVQGLVSTFWEEPGWLWGAMDVAFLNDELYVLVSGAGPAWASPSFPRSASTRPSAICAKEAWGATCSPNLSTSLRASHASCSASSE